ncbi:ABC transporter substrate-binding protein [Kitasatospora herbaricolor]|uniref:ABC transporter substrate-binding protein n=1 Tax=Kitasatospora herbaricolor TaxID=68217 RepID=UPI00174B9328|nr:ABC transporter substrate-binding protein [Kitasatospora herbaricolor]MDQ0311024.1 multiple sugar transport system substrate-binding protein [Kitasatospora herbaricolor]GGV32202.1 ABC transporter substrate-binding protein [Kitasatospora herbaricolor]
MHATTSRRARRTIAAVTGSAVLALLATACTGTNSGGGNDDSASGKDVTITFWHGWSQDSETKAINDNIAAFEKAHPNIHVKAVGNIADDKTNQALRAGGDDAPDVVSSFTTNNVGTFCSSNVFADLNPLLKKDGIDAAKTFPAAMLNYTQFKGNQCSLPLLGDVFGLYYNKKAFAAAGITAPPKTFSEFADAAAKLTIADGDGFKQLGFMPNYHGYESTTEHFLGQFGPSYFGSDGKSSIATDPKVAEMLTWQKGLVDKLGGFDKLEKYRASFGDEFSAKNPFHTGQVAMAIDGEWRTASLATDKPDFEWATAPFPVPDAEVSTYGRGYQTGTIIGIAKNSKKQAAAWELVKYLTTNTDAVVSFANAIHNVPSTFEALNSPKLDADANFKTFLDIAKNPNSGTTPASVNGGAYIVSLQNLGYDYESGKQTDLAAGLAATAKEIDAAVNQAK